MKTQFFLTVSASGSVKTTKGHPGLGWNEVAIQVKLTLPDALFKKPQLSAELVVPDEAAIPTEITAETMANVKDAIKSASGMDVRLSLIPIVEA